MWLLRCIGFDGKLRAQELFYFSASESGTEISIVRYYISSHPSPLASTIPRPLFRTQLLFIFDEKRRQQQH
jgi:hypothetical protein